jgi:hypothetical protein
VNDLRRRNEGLRRYEKKLFELEATGRARCLFVVVRIGNMTPK